MQGQQHVFSICHVDLMVYDNMWYWLIVEIMYESRMVSLWKKKSMNKLNIHKAHDM